MDLSYFGDTTYISMLIVSIISGLFKIRANKRLDTGRGTSFDSNVNIIITFLQLGLYVNAAIIFGFLSIVFLFIIHHIGGNMGYYLIK